MMKARQIMELTALSGFQPAMNSSAEIMKTTPTREITVLAGLTADDSDEVNLQSSPSE